MINVDKLTKELMRAGIQTCGCSSDGIVWAMDGMTQIQMLPDVAAVIAAHDPTESQQPTEVIFDLPIRAPSITVGDLFVESRNIKDDPDEAMDEAMAEADKGKGKAKSLDLIARSSLRMIDKLRRQVAVLEKRLDKLDNAK